MEISLPNSPVELKSFVQHLDKALLNLVIERAREYFKEILHEIDDLIAEQRGDEFCIEHLREVWYQTCLGPVSVKRRQYRDKEGRYHYLLDEFLGMGKYRHVTTNVQQTVLELATTMPYRRSAEVLRKVTAIDLPHQTIWRLLGKLADPYLEKADNEVKHFLDTGEISEGKGKQLSRLMVEADGVILSLQREKDRRAEVKVGIAYEGWEKVGKDRFKTVNKTIYSALAGEDLFWAGMSLKLQEKYDLSRVRDTIVGGDGARWVKNGADYINGRFQLDRYHLNRELCFALGNDRETIGRMRQACDRGDVTSSLEILAEEKIRAKGEQAKRIDRAYNYIKDNSAGIEDYRLKLGNEGKGLRRTGAMEGNVDKLVVRRMKNQGMSWSLKGIRRMLCMRFLFLEGKLENSLQATNNHDIKVELPRKKVRLIVKRATTPDPTAWLKVGLPALSRSNPWVRTIRAITNGPAF